MLRSLGSRVGKVLLRSRWSPGYWFTSDPHEVRLVYFNKLVYAWPLVLMGLLVGPLASLGLDGATLGWMWITTALFVVATMSIDLPRNQSLFLAVTVGFIWLFGNQLAEWGLPVWSHVYEHFAGLGVDITEGTMRALSEMLAIGWLINLVYCLLEHRVRINHNEVVVHAFLRRIDSLPRLGSTFRLNMPDSLELVSGLGAGTLEISRGARRLVLPDVLFLYPRFPRIDRLLDSWAITEIAADDTLEDSDESDSPVSPLAH